MQQHKTHKSRQQLTLRATNAALWDWSDAWNTCAHTHHTENTVTLYTINTTRANLHVQFCFNDFLPHEDTVTSVSSRVRLRNALSVNTAMISFDIKYQCCTVQILTNSFNSPETLIGCSEDLGQYKELHSFYENNKHC